MASPLVLLREGADAPPFFITHGLGGTTEELARIVASLKFPGPVYGVQWAGLDRHDQPHDRFEAMADYFTDAIAAAWPQGPYLLAGLSIGGLPMLEVANRLSRRGGDVAMLAFLDTYPHPGFWPFTCWMGSMWQRVRRHAATTMRMPLRSSVPHLIRLGGNFWSHFRSRRGATSQSNVLSDTGASLELQRLREAAWLALTQYRPRHYSGRIIFLKAEIATRFPADPARVWNHQAEGLEVHRFPCDHVGLITTHADQVADCLSARIEHALRATRPGVNSCGAPPR